jgi:hypothetical protein
VPLLNLIGVDVQQGSVGRVTSWAAAFGRLGRRWASSVLIVYVASAARAIRRWQTMLLFAAARLQRLPLRHTKS